MGQIFNRIRRITRTYLNDVHSPLSTRYSDEEEELRRIIDELNKEKNKKANESESQKQAVHPETMTTEEACIILGINTGAGIDEIKSAYKKRIKEYHPDRVASLGEDLQKLAGKKTREINHAYELLKKIKRF